MNAKARKTSLLFKLILPVALIAALLSACGVLSPAQPTPVDPNLVTTLAYQTAVAASTQAAIQTLIAELTQMAQPATQAPQVPTNTLAPDLPTATATQVPPTNTPVFTLPPTNTPVPPTATPRPIPCDAAQFVDDVSVKDGTSFSPGTLFKKTWRLKNVGTCTWTTSYAIVFKDGDQMDGKSSIALTGSVAPGSTVDLSVDLKAPSKTGSYQGNWLLKNASGSTFGLGSSANKAFWVKITVGEVSMVYDFTAKACDADWRNASAALPCGGTPGADAGMILKVPFPISEAGTDDEPGIRVEPQKIDNGLISGKYPEFEVKSGDHFKAVIGCWKDQTFCKVTFQLNYQIGDGTIQTLKSWDEVYDNSLAKLDVDLSDLAGKKVKFILTVSANGPANQDSVFWLMPRIMR